MKSFSLLLIQTHKKRHFKRKIENRNIMETSEIEKNFLKFCGIF